MKKYTKPEVQVTFIQNDSIITLSGVGTQNLTSDTKVSFSSLGLNS